MERKLSPHALTILSLIENIAQLTLVHHEYRFAKDVVGALRKVCSELGFDIDDDIFRYIISSIGNKPSVAMKEDFERLAAVVAGIDIKLDAEPLAGDKRYGE